MSEITHLDTKSELQQVLDASKLVLADFYAEWCGPCKMLAPVLAEVAEETANNVKLVKIDIDKAEELAMDYRVMSVPTLVYFKDGTAVAKSVGLQSKSQILRQIEKL